MRKASIVGVVVVIAVIIVGFFIYRAQNKENATQPTAEVSNAENNTNGAGDMTPPPAEDPTPPSPSKTVPESVKANPLHGGLTLEQAIAIYSKNGYRFQITNCRATPGTMTVKQSQTKVMFQNFDTKAHTFISGKQKFTVGALDFAIVTFSEAGSHTVSCDGAGSAEVLVQK